METGGTGEILLDGEYYYGWTHRPASPSFLVSLPSFLTSSSFLALTQEKKQKKVKAPPGPGKLAGYRLYFCLPFFLP